MRASSSDKVASSWRCIIIRRGHLTKGSAGSGRKAAIHACILFEPHLCVMLFIIFGFVAAKKPFDDVAILLKACLCCSVIIGLTFTPF